MSDPDELGSNLGPAPAPSSKVKKAAKGMPDTVWIQLEENEEIPPTGLFLGHNGHSYLLKAGEPVPVPAHIIEILDHAVLSMPVTDPTTKQVIGHRERMRFPYRRVEAPTQSS